MKRMKGRLLTALLSIAMVFTMIPMMAQEAYAKGNSPSIVMSGDLYSFTTDAPITTVRLDIEKFTKGNVTNGKSNLSYHAAAAINQISNELADKKDISYDEAREIVVNSGYKIYTTVNTDIQKKMEEVLTV